MANPLDLALAIAAAGTAVFPCGANKRPCIPKAKGGRGFHDATTDPAEIRRLFGFDGAVLVGIPTGERSGIDVLDVDYRNGGGAWEDANAERLPETRTHRTQHGGRHYVFLHAPGVRNSAAKFSLAPGIDVRGDGGYIIMPPSTGYTVASDAPVRHWPDWLLAMVLARPVRDESPETTTPTVISSKRIEGFVRSLTDRITGAADGSKHYTLRNMALLFGGIASQAGIGEKEAVERLVRALPATAQDANAYKTAHWGIVTGQARPIQLTDRPQYQSRKTINGSGNGHIPPPTAEALVEDSREPPPIGRIRAGADFIGHHVPPVWLIDGVVQRSRLYACTSLTGHGKTAVWLFNACMIHAGRKIGQRDAFQGNVLFLAGENPSDLEARMIGLANGYNIPRDRLPYVLPGSFPLTEEEVEALKREIAGLGVPLALIVGDTASSFFPGDDENSNVQAGQYARTLRQLTECEGNPAVVVLSHPVKNASHGNLLPRGGGAFLNELDGNLSLWSEVMGEVTELHWHGKIRGPDFAPLGYRLNPVPTGLTDEKGRPEVTIIAEPMSDEAVADYTQQSLANDDAVLRVLRDHRDWSFAQIANYIGWIDKDDRPERWRVQRAVRALQADKLIEQQRRGAAWTLTRKGEKAVEDNN